jgi:ketosteroid isomerase-like protein
MNASEVADLFFRAIENSDLAALRQIYHDDIQVWHNFSGVSQSKADNIGALAAMGALRSIKYVVQERIASGDRIAQRHHLCVETPAGKRFELPVAIFVTVRDRKIVRIDEYFDSAQLNPLLTEMAAITAK